MPKISKIALKNKKRTDIFDINPIVSMVGETRFELVTSWSRTKCPTNCAIPRANKEYKSILIFTQ